MKKIAKLILFFSFCFVVIFFVDVVLMFLSSWVDLARIIPLETRTGEEVANLAWKALPAAIYLSILLCLSYAARRKIPVLLSILCIISLGFIFTAGFSFGIGRIGAVRPILKPVSPIQAEPGLILSQSNNAIILLKESSYVRGPRVVSIPGRPLIYQELPLGPNNAILSLPALPFGNENPWFIRSLRIDLSLSAEQLKSRLESSVVSFVAYAFSLILLLGSLRLLLELSQWPLANMFLGALVFRLILTLEVFLNVREINALIGSFMTGRIPPTLITPLVFSAMGILVILFTLLDRFARPGRKGDV